MNATHMSPIQDKATAQAGEDAKANNTGCSGAIERLLNLVGEIQRLAKSGEDPGRGCPARREGSPRRTETAL